MNLFEIAKMPVTVERIHESCFQSHQLLRWTEEMLTAGVPGPIVARLIHEIEELGAEIRRPEARNEI